MGYHAFAIGFYEDKIELAGTESTLPCFKPDFIKFLHASITVGTYVSMCPWHRTTKKRIIKAVLKTS